MPNHKSGFYLQQPADNADGKTKPQNHYIPVECSWLPRQSKNAFTLNAFRIGQLIFPYNLYGRPGKTSSKQHK